MAIERVEGTPKMEWTVPTLLQLGGALLLVIISCLLGWFSFANWRFKATLVQSYQDYAAGRPLASVRQGLEDALSWRPLHTGARELLAKVECDEGRFESARKHYLTLRAQGYAVPQVQVGLGVIALKEAGTLEKPKEIQEKVTEAFDAFKKAGNVPEAEVGMGHCELVLAQKLGETARYARAQKVFNAIRTEMDQTREFRARITRDGLVDYYTGLGKSLASSDVYDPAAVGAFRACFQYTPTWALPMANILSLEAKRFSTFSDGNDALLKLQPDITGLRNQAGNLWKSLRSDARDQIREPWMMYSLSIAQAWGRAGNGDQMATIVRDLAASAGFEGRLEPFLLDAQVRLELAVRDDPNPAQQEVYVTKAVASANELVGRLPADESARERRARAYNDVAWGLAWKGGYMSTEGFYTQAVGRLTEALRLFPDDYVINRNMAIVLKRFKKPPSSPAAFLEKCRAAVAKEKEFAEDFDKLQKYIEAK